MTLAHGTRADAGTGDAAGARAKLIAHRFPSAVSTRGPSGSGVTMHITGETTSITLDVDAIGPIRCALLGADGRPLAEQAAPTVTAALNWAESRTGA